MGEPKVLVASCLWVAISLTPAWAGGPGQAPPGEDCVQGTSSYPRPFSPGEEPDSSFSMSLKRLRLAPLRVSASSVMDETDIAFQGMRARYEIGFGDYSLEFSGGYIPGMKSPVSPEAPLYHKAYLGYINLTIPLSQFYLKGGAFFGQNTDALGPVFKRPYEEQNTERELLGYQIGGGYRFSDSLSMQAGWGRAAQEYETARESLRAWRLQARISLGWRMSVTSEVGYVDFTKGDGEKTREEAFYGSTKWQINF